MKTIKIDRSIWACGFQGESGHQIRMYNPDSDKCCCLGIRCLIEGASKESMEYSMYPGKESSYKMPNWMKK